MEVACNEADSSIFMSQFSARSLLSGPSPAGKCLKVHDERLKQAYTAAKDDIFTYKYSQELLQELEQLQSQVDRAIRRFEERMAIAMPNVVRTQDASLACSRMQSANILHSRCPNRTHRNPSQMQHLILTHAQKCVADDA